jgi:hypothetical protein
LVLQLLELVKAVTTPSPEYAIDLRNVLEDLVVDEAKEQIQRLGNKVRIQIALGEVAAYALNRLPPLYASTDRGWLQQRKRANTELKSQIINAVHHGMMAVRRDPLRQPKPIPQIELESTALSLSRLANLLNKSELTWKDVPAAVEAALVNGAQGIIPINLITDPTQRRVSELMSYLKRSKVHHKVSEKQDSDRNTKKTNQESSLLDNPHKASDMLHQQQEAVVAKDKEFDSYMLSASCLFVNALERVIIPIAQTQMQRLDTVLARKVKLEDVVAYSLNRLPPLYATCEQGLLQQRHRANAELASEIESTVVQSILTLSKSPKRLVGPLPLARFNLEYEQALIELRQILKRGDITWRNVHTIVEKALEYVRRNRVDWRQQWQTLGQIYNDLSLQPGDADITLVDSTQGNVLTIKANSRKVFGTLVDNPRELASITLTSLPEVAYIELRSSLFDFPLTYTRSEMVDDGVLPY